MGTTIRLFFDTRREGAWRSRHVLKHVRDYDFYGEIGFFGSKFIHEEASREVPIRLGRPAGFAFPQNYNSIFEGDQPDDCCYWLTGKEMKAALLRTIDVKENKMNSFDASYILLAEEITKRVEELGDENVRLVYWFV